VRFSSGLGLAEPALDQILDAALHVIAQFALEVSFKPIALPTEEINELLHGLMQSRVKAG
jgi:hypothetical protein